MDAPATLVTPPAQGRPVPDRPVRVHPSQTTQDDSFVCLQNSFLKLLASLALSDALFLLFAFLCFGLPSVSQWYRQKLFNRSVVFVFGAIHTARTASVLLTLSVNVERFYAIVFPLKHFRSIFENIWNTVETPFGRVSWKNKQNLTKLENLFHTVLHKAASYGSILS